MATSVGNQIRRLDGLLGTDDLSEWEQKFVADIALSTQTGALTVGLTDAQVEKIEEIFSKHFAG